MTTRILHILAFLLLWGFPALAAEVVVVQGERMAPFEAALHGFEATAGVRSVERLVLSELRGADVVRSVREARPRMVLAIGREALARVKDIREIPIVYVMVAAPPSAAAHGNVTGVTMGVPAERYLAFAHTDLASHRVGLLFDPGRTGAMAREARQAAQRLGITLVTREVHAPRQALQQLAALRGKVDVLWLLPDPTVVTAETLEAIALFSQENRVPVLAFAAKYLQHGALAAFEVDPADMGRQAGRMARRIMNGTPPGEVPDEAPARITLRVNGAVARNLGITRDLGGE
ncbi:ABC transporter substrate binding protein [Geobacter sp.]|uniref:ABC transporter substrate-binding protein n=1 Tax=Geobacter sp. TaxID=46610 RepID=UPI00260774E7|nr:ABC transporter substrate binding protein [Geobacter sp.]